MYTKKPATREAATSSPNGMRLTFVTRVIRTPTEADLRRYDRTPGPV